MRVESIRQFVVGVALAGAIGLGGAAGVAAQDASVGSSEEHPAHIHVGTCADLDPNPVAPLNNLVPVGTSQDDDDDDDDVTTEVMGVLTAGPVTYSESDDIEFEWETMIGASHAIAVHESEENMQNYIACGDIGGVVFSDDDDEKNLVIGLHSVGDSGYSGIAILSEDDDGEVDVEIFVAAPAADPNADTGVTATPEG